MSDLLPRLTHLQLLTVHYLRDCKGDTYLTASTLIALLSNSRIRGLTRRFGRLMDGLERRGCVVIQRRAETRYKITKKGRRLYERALEFYMELAEYNHA